MIDLMNKGLKLRETRGRWMRDEGRRTKEEGRGTRREG